MAASGGSGPAEAKVQRTSHRDKPAIILYLA
jgi:hypothetical protein